MNYDELSSRLSKLLSESYEAVKVRESTTLTRLIGSLENQFLLFGAGNLGRKSLKTLERIGKLPSAFIDNNPVLWGSEISGVPIMSPIDSIKIFDPTKVGVITTIWCGEATDKMSDRIEPLIKLGFCNIALFGHLAWKFSDDFLPHYCLDLPSKVIEKADEIRQAFSLLSDDESRLLFVDHIEWRLFLDYDVLPYPSSHEIYFNDRYVNQSKIEVLYDIGAYTGDSVQSFMNTVRGQEFTSIHSFEPSPHNFAKLQNYVTILDSNQAKVFAHQLALGDVVGSIQVETENGPASRVGLGNETVPLSTIDVFSQTNQSPSFIKIDIEGFEPQCLKGAQRVITNHAPVVAVCVYHLQSHIWEILLLLHSYYPSYSFSLCPHLADGWDLVLYAVPQSRKPSATIYLS
jgi:FkbM family methyltransferase